MNPHDPKFILAHNAGALVSRRCRESRTTVTLYDGRQAGLDVSGPDDEVWQVRRPSHFQRHKRPERLAVLDTPGRNASSKRSIAPASHPEADAKASAYLCTRLATEAH